MSRQPEPLLTRLAALVAGLGLLLLVLVSASPEMHAGMHAAVDASHADCDHAGADAPVGDADHACAVTLFAHGAMALVIFCLLILARPVVAGLALRATDDVVVARPRYRLVPSHAPPAA